MSNNVTTEYSIPSSKVISLGAYTNFLINVEGYSTVAYSGSFGMFAGIGGKNRIGWVSGANPFTIGDTVFAFGSTGASGGTITLT